MTTPDLPPLISPPPAPGLVPFAHIQCEVGPLTSLGEAPTGERRVVPLLGGVVRGPELNGRILPGGADWQIARRDGVLEIAAHYVIETLDGARIEVQSQGLRHGPPEVMARLAAGEAVPPEAYFFRTAIRLATGHPDWLHLNRVMAVATGERLAACVRLAVFRLA